MILPDRTAPGWPSDARIPAMANLKPTDALDETLKAISARHGAATAKVVAMQLEYPGPPAPPPRRRSRLGSLPGKEETAG